MVLLRRNYDIADEEQPFSFGLITSLIFRERRLVRDLTISALFLSLFALAPIFFWQVLMAKVLPYHSMSTFTVLPWNGADHRAGGRVHVFARLFVANPDNSD